ncbi:hypothetical protein ACVWYG_000901 [Pedobacter sp. UYEF25]
MKLKKKIAAFFAILYVTSAMGLAFSLHFCAGKLDNVKIFESSATCKVCLEKTTAKKTNDCCKTSKISLTVKDSHQLEAKTDLPKFFAAVLFVRAPVVAILKNVITTGFTFVSNKAPPLSAIISLHLFNCIFRN